MRPGRPEAAAVIADPPRASATATTSTRRVRVRGALQGAIAIAIGAALIAFGRRAPGIVAVGIGSAIAAAALTSPLGLFAAIERGFAAFGAAVGRGLTWTVMPAVFYGFFVPFRLLFRRGRRDTMRRRFEPDAPSYWTPADPRRQSPESYTRAY